MTSNNKNKTEEAYKVIVSPPPPCPLNNLARHRPKEGEGE